MFVVERIPIPIVQCDLAKRMVKSNRFTRGVACDKECASGRISTPNSAACSCFDYDLISTGDGIDKDGSGRNQVSEVRIGLRVIGVALIGISACRVVAVVNGECSKWDGGRECGYACRQQERREKFFHKNG